MVNIQYNMQNFMYRKENDRKFFNSKFILSVLM
jgi:hypothetical protein